MTSKKRTKGKGKEKKLARRAQAEELRRKLEVVKALNGQEDLLSSLAPFRQYRAKDHAFALECIHGERASEAVVDACMELLERNMAAMYEDAGWGWRPAKKRGELVDSTARLLVAWEQPADAGVDAAAALDTAVPSAGGPRQLAAFVHLRFELEENRSMAYIWEVQVAPRFARLGLGRRLLQVCELLARRAGIEYMMATVFKDNVTSMQFFTQGMRYVVDEDSPSNHEVEDAAHEILSKDLRPAAAPAAPAAAGK